MDPKMQEKFDLRFETIVSSDNNVIIKLKTSPICLSVYADEFESVKNEVVSLNTLKWTEYCDAMQSKYDNGEFEKETMSLEDKYSLGFDNTDKTVTIEALELEVYLTLSFEDFENSKAELLSVDKKDWVDYCSSKLSSQDSIVDSDKESKSEDGSTLGSEFGEKYIEDSFTSLFENMNNIKLELELEPEDEPKNNIEPESEASNNTLIDPVNGKFDMIDKIILTENKELTQTDLLECIDINIRAYIKGNKFNISKYKGNKVKGVEISENDLDGLRNNTHSYNIMDQTVFIDYGTYGADAEDLIRGVVNIILSLNATLKSTGVKIIPEENDAFNKITSIKYKLNSEKRFITIII